MMISICTHYVGGKYSLEVFMEVVESSSKILYLENSHLFATADYSAVMLAHTPVLFHLIYFSVGMLRLCFPPSSSTTKSQANDRRVFKFVNLSYPEKSKTNGCCTYYFFRLLLKSQRLQIGTIASFTLL